MLKKLRVMEFTAAILIPLAAGGLSAALAHRGMEMFRLLRQPPLSPPAWVFPVVWTMLYILMGMASYYIYVSGASEPRKERALTVYAVQLAFNFLWPLIFFNMGLLLFAFVWLILLWLLVLICAVLFYYVDPKAGKLMIPYVLWGGFAGYLNFGVYLLNK